jgi:hypothetical protein
MLITVEEAKKILALEVVSDVFLLKVVRRYIYDRTGHVINEINRPQNLIQVQLLQLAIQSCTNYYLNNGK